MAGVVLFLRSIRPCESMHANVRTFSEQVIASIIYDSRCGMSDVAFRTAPPIGGPSCYYWCCCNFIKKNFDSALRNALNMTNSNFMASALWPRFQGQGHGHHFDIFIPSPSRVTSLAHFVTRKYARVHCAIKQIRLFSVSFEIVLAESTSVHPFNLIGPRWVPGLHACFFSWLLYLANSILCLFINNWDCCPYN